VLRRSVAVVSFLAVLAALQVGIAPPAAACSCVGFQDDEAALEAADVVFTGELLEVRTPPTGEVWSSADPERFVFAVDRVYKGEARARQSVVTAREGASCGLELSGVGPFLVFASTESVLNLQGKDGELFSHLCTGSRKLGSEAVLSRLGEGRPPDAGASPIGSTEDDGTSRAAVVSAAVIAVVMAGALVCLRIRRSRTTAPTS